MQTFRGQCTAKFDSIHWFGYFCLKFGSHCWEQTPMIYHVCSEQAGPLNTWNWNVWAVPPNYMATFATRISVVKKYMLVHFDSQTFQATVFRRTLPAMLGNWHKHDFQTGSVIFIPFFLLHMHVHGVGQSSTFFVFLGSNTKNTNSLLLW